MTKYHEHKFFHATRANGDRCDECGSEFMAHYNGACPMSDDDIAAERASLEDRYATYAALTQDAPVKSFDEWLNS